MSRITGKTIDRRFQSVLAALFLFTLPLPLPGQDPPAQKREYTPELKRFMDFIHNPALRSHSCTAKTPEEFVKWRESARPVLRTLLRLDDMEAELRGHQPKAVLGAVEDLGDYTRCLGRIQTEPEMSIPFWLLVPKGPGPFPVGIFVHGHSSGVGMDEYAGIAASEEVANQIREVRLDVGPRAVRLGFIAIIPAVRGFKPVDIPDLIGFYNKKPCRAHLIQCLAVGRTAFGERIWDIQRLVDYALTLPNGDRKNILLMGHSGGGGLTAFAAAVEPRITVAVASGWYNTLVAESGALNHCECNTVPGLLRFGEVWDVAGLIAPRPFLVVSGTDDLARRASDPNVVRAVRELRRVYSAAGAEGNFDQAVGKGGHIFFHDLQWPFVMKHIERSGTH